MREINNLRKSKGTIETEKGGESPDTCPQNEKRCHGVTTIVFYSRIVVVNHCKRDEQQHNYICESLEPALNTEVNDLIRPAELSHFDKKSWKWPN